MAGIWLDGNGGLAVTADAAHATLDTHLGYDFRVCRGRLNLGPFIGYAEVFQPSDALRPNDAHIV